MKLRPVRDWFRFRADRLSFWSVGVQFIRTVPEGVSFVLLLYFWRVEFTVVFGDWE